MLMGLFKIEASMISCMVIISPAYALVWLPGSLPSHGMPSRDVKSTSCFLHVPASCRMTTHCNLGTGCGPQYVHVLETC